jgi:hypothetical protein
MAEYWETGNKYIDDQTRTAGGFYRNKVGSDNGEQEWVGIGGGTNAQGQFDPSVGRTDPGASTPTPPPGYDQFTGGNYTTPQPANGPFKTSYDYNPAAIGSLNSYGIDPTKAGWNQYTGSSAPKFDLNTSAGQAALNERLQAAGAGKQISGLDVFYTGGGNNDQLMQAGDLLGVDRSKFNLGDQSGYNAYKDAVAQQASQYSLISGLSGGFGGSGNDREAYSSLYKNINGVLTPLGDPRMYNAPTKGSWLDEHGAAKVGILGTAAVLAGPWVAGLAGGAGAGTAAGGAAASTGAGTAAGGAGTAGLSGGIANALGLGAQWGSLSAVQQAAVIGALQGGAQGAIGGGGLKGALRGAALGGFTGGAGAWAGPAIAGATGWSPAVSNAVGAAGIGGLRAGITGGNPWAGAAGAGIGSYIGSLLNGMGANSYFSGLGGNLAGGFAGSAVNSAMGGSGGQQRPTGMSGSYSPASITVAGGAGGLSGGSNKVSWQHKPTQGEIGNAQFVQATGEPIFQQAAQQALLDRFKDDPEFIAKVREQHPDWLTA